MGHVEESTGRVPLHPHISGLGEPCQRAESTGSSDLGLVLLVGSEVSDAANRIALNLDIRG